MHNFDPEQLATGEKDRTFRLRGEEFVYRTLVEPEVVCRYFDSNRVDTEHTNMETLAIWDETVLAFLEPGQEERWQAVRALRGEQTVTLTHLTQLIEWLIAEQSARPTGPRSDSPSGSAPLPNGTSSKAESVSAEEAVSAA